MAHNSLHVCNNLTAYKGYQTMALPASPDRNADHGASLLR